MDFPDLAARLASVRQRIATGQARGGWEHPVRIVAVTKGWGPEAVEAAVAAGLVDVGENRVHEALSKQAAVHDQTIAWHLIGHLQTNKARDAVGRFVLIHSVDSDRLAERLSREVQKREQSRALDVLLQVNMADEQQKFGCESVMASDLAHRITDTPGLRLRGLMTMAPLTDDTRVVRNTFTGLRTMRDALVATGIEAPELSMGMSGDFEIAVEAGATVLRLGTVLFGERPHG